MTALKKNCQDWTNPTLWLECGNLPQWASQSLKELQLPQNRERMKERFASNIVFGTGGMRGPMIAASPTQPEGLEHPALGSAFLNDFTVVRATWALYQYACKHYGLDTLKLVAYYDSRYFSRYFAELTACIWGQLGGAAYVAQAARPTPQLSFITRAAPFHAGVMITASHNPPKDNGYKVYFSDGGQIIDKHTQGIMDYFPALSLEAACNYLGQVSSDQYSLLSPSWDGAYEGYLKALFPKKLQYAPHIVYTPLHGVGGAVIPEILKDQGVVLTAVEEQMQSDPKFSKTASANPEMPSAFDRAIKRAKLVGAEAILATDPDADRLAVAVLEQSGEYSILTGNQLGALLLDYYLGRVPPARLTKALCLKTLVTSPLLQAIAEKRGVRTVNTLTGFKWLGDKLKQYEVADTMPEVFFALEESCGYLFEAQVRDKDACAAACLVCHWLDSLKGKGKTPQEALMELYLKHGFYAERLLNLHYEASDGLERAAALLQRYAEMPPRAIGPWKVLNVKHYNAQELRDEDGQLLPKQAFCQVFLEKGLSYAIRPSGTEPKLKYYLFAHSLLPSASRFGEIQAKTMELLERLKVSVEAFSNN